MLQTTRSSPARDSEDVDIDRGWQILNEQAERQLNMSGHDFVERYRAGDLGDLDQTEVFDVSLLLPFVGEPLRDGRGHR